MSNIIKLILVIALIVLLVAIGPLAFIWAWNTLFGSVHVIEYTFSTWLAAAVVMAALSPNVKISKKD